MREVFVMLYSKTKHKGYVAFEVVKLEMVR